MKKLKKEIKDWGSALLFAVLVATPLRWAIAEPFKIPTPSMEGSLLVGDFLLVSKYHYGSRTAKTILQIPLTFQKIWGTEIPSYLEWIDAPFWRSPGISEVKKGDAVVFNYPGELENPVDMRTYYIKRCVATAGDTITVINKQVIINGIEQKNAPNQQSSYFIKTNTEIKERIFKKHHISEVTASRGGYYVHASSKNMSAFHDFDFVEEVIELSNDSPDSRTFPQSPNIAWTADNFGPLYIPKKGETIALSSHNVALYGNTIMNYDLNENVEIKSGKLYVDGKMQSSYTFKQDYFFMMGDNRHNSLDSRYWGFVPMDHVVGKAVATWLSIDENESIWNGVRWKRVFKGIE